MRRAIVAACAAVLAVTLGICVRNLAIWLFTTNTTDSLPHGLYVRTFQAPAKGLLLWFPMPESIAGMVKEKYPAEFEWLSQPNNGFLKPIVAVAGDTICRDKRGVFSVNSKPLGLALKRDTRGLPLPSWGGCRKLSDDNVAVFSSYNAGSFDSRYYGAVRLPVPAVTYRPFITWDAKK